ncbi:hypothetical protein PpBr36_02986, partial [Pyricularia pennisetigena]|uniref:hypothetical protein n=1 Tax=Pyricularia pennisetigena TaxID=1578925 RepID=UPI001153CF99
SSESRLYTFSQETKDHLRKFRLGTSRANDPQAVICNAVCSITCHIHGRADLNSTRPAELSTIPRGII